MKNSSIFWTTLIMIPLLVAVCVGVVHSAKEREENGGQQGYGTASLRNEIKIPASEADALEIIYTSKNIKVYPATADEIVIKEYLYSGREDAKATVSHDETESGKKLVTVTGAKLQAEEIFLMGIGERIEVYLPKAAVESLTIRTNSGNISCEDSGFALQAKGVNVQASSGNLRWLNTTADEITFTTNSGNIDAENLSGEVSAKAGSGNIHVGNIAGSMTAKTGSGNIRIEELAGAGNAEANSGSVHIAVIELTGNLEMNTGSGSIGAVLPKDAEFVLEAQAGSGKVRTGFDEKVIYNEKHNRAAATIGNSPALSVKADAGSGNINITYQ
ncbi:MAG: DUF4097 family beta strand repeat protein [Lachnospiraceae bacterium]|nr:DUF4097 family beta strand repeat protein [Lachnospiraceae bacterium]